jgi:hypothetical protein
MDLANTMSFGRSIGPIQVTSTTNGASLDCRDCGPEVVCLEAVGVNPGNDTTIDTKLQHSTDDSTFADITGATFTQIAGDTENQLTVRSFFNRARRYVRAVVTITGTSPTPMLCIIVGVRKTSY